MKISVKKLLSVILALIMLAAAFSAVSTGAFAAEKHNIIVKSAQGLFKDVAASFDPGEAFSIQLDLKTKCQLSDVTISVRYDEEQIRVRKFESPFSLPGPISNETEKGEYLFVVGTANELIDTTKGGEFLSLIGKARDTFNKDQEIIIDVQTLRGGRYKDDETVDISFEELYVAWSKVENTNFTLASSFKDKINFNPQPSTEKPTEKPTQAPTTTAKPTEKPTEAPTTTAKPTEKPTEATETTAKPTAKPTEATEKPSSTPTEKPTATETKEPAKNLIYGDTDLSGVVNIKDATLIQQHLAKIKTMSSDSLAVANVDGDESVSVKDATCIQKSLALLSGSGKVNQPYTKA
ncbi:MAG: hypothetical protein IIU14_07355 [Ruminococcus sp.]|nr:hypothetical protein [Ruminococcus sp.]